MSTKIVEGFSLSHAAILDGTTGAEAVAGSLYGIRSGTMQVTVDSYDNTGDDAVLSSWFWFNYATVTIQGGYIPFDTLAFLSGTTVTSSGTAPNDFYSVPLWNQSALNQSPKPMLVRVPAKDSNGVVRNIDFVLYKVQFQPFTFDGPSYKNGLLINYGGRALLSTADEKGNPLSEKTIGRVISAPSGLAEAGSSNLI
jgi:hypothetical protein